MFIIGFSSQELKQRKKHKLRHFKEISNLPLNGVSSIERKKIPVNIN